MSLTRRELYLLERLEALALSAERAASATDASGLRYVSVLSLTTPSDGSRTAQKLYLCQLVRGSANLVNLRLFHRIDASRTVAILSTLST